MTVIDEPVFQERLCDEPQGRLLVGDQQVAVYRCAIERDAILQSIKDSEVVLTE